MPRARNSCCSRSSAHYSLHPTAASCTPFLRCIAQAVRIRQVADPTVGNLPNAVKQIVRESGWGKLFEGLPSILFRQISFGMMKFLVFDFFTGTSSCVCARVFPPLGGEGCAIYLQVARFSRSVLSLLVTWFTRLTSCGMFPAAHALCLLHLSN